MKTAALFISFIVLSAAAVCADVTLYCPFDGTAEPRIHKGDGTPVLKGETKYTEGVRGQGLIVGDGAAEQQVSSHCLVVLLQVMAFSGMASSN